MKIILVCIGIFQEYILDNIHNLFLHGNNDIVIITEKAFFEKFKKWTSIVLIDRQNLQSNHINNYSKKSSMNREWRNGFWYNTSLRMFYVHAYMKQYNIENIIHIENDVLLYENMDILKEKFKKQKIYCAFDSENRVILSLVYIPNYEKLESILDQYDYAKNDMQNFGQISNQMIETLPIIHIENKNNVNQYNINFQDFNAIFDAAAIGQYLGGIDKENDSNDTRGFVNETCIIKFDKYDFVWIKHNNLWSPYLQYQDKFIKIVNLHLHCKELNKFLSDNPIEYKYIKPLS